ncbi:MAG: restriction endonuclease subunit S [Nitrospira sp.]|nr:MAG: restriction endonuclease subunit S [Nitrospira sp.]
MKNGWKTKSLGEVCSFLNRGISPRYLESGGICVLNQKCIRDHRVSYEPSRRHDAQAKKVGSERLIHAGDVLVNSTGTGTLGRVAQLREAPPEPTTVDSHVTIVRPTPGKFYPEFFGYMLVVIEDAIKEAGEGCGGQTELARSALAEKFSVHYPESLPEQQRIVGILDEAFEGIAIATANAEKNLRNARALFESHLESVFTQRGEGWDRVTLETLLERGWIESHLDGNHGSDYPRKDEFISEGVPYISANCLDDERVDMTRAKYLSPSRAALLRKGIAKDNDVLFAHNATVGPVAILHTDEEKVILGTSLTYYRCNPKHILPEYLAHYMRSFGFKSQYLQVMKQSTRNQVPITKQREFFHVIPPLDEQKEIVGALDGLFENGQRLESIYQQTLAALDELKQSLLHQAFSGKL